jgi:hypothetical protein
MTASGKKDRCRSGSHAAGAALPQEFLHRRQAAMITISAFLVFEFFIPPSLFSILLYIGLNIIELKFNFPPNCWRPFLSLAGRCPEPGKGLPGCGHEGHKMWRRRPSPQDVWARQALALMKMTFFTVGCSAGN